LVRKKKSKKAIIKKVTRKPREDAWYVLDISRGKVIPKQFLKKALEKKRSGRDLVLYWDDPGPKVHPWVRDPKWKLYIKRVR